MRRKLDDVLDVITATIIVGSIVALTLGMIVDAIAKLSAG